MRTNRIIQDRHEPMGIVIADGGRGDATPKFTAFVWGPVPDEVEAREAVPELVAAH